MRKTRAFQLATLIALLAVGAPAFASDNPVTAGAKGDTPPSYLRQKPAPTGEGKGEMKVATKDSGSSFRVVLAFAFVGALGGGALYLKKKRRGGPLLKEQLRLNMVGSISVGHKAQVTLISVGGEAMLLGVTENGVTALRTYVAAELPLLSIGTPAAAEPEAAPRGAAAKSKTTKSPAIANPVATQAFRDLLDSATQSDAQARARALHAKKYAEAMAREAESLDFTESDEPPDSGPRMRDDEEDDDALPPHLRDALREPMRSDSFGEPDGQAAELLRRFKGLQK